MQIHVKILCFFYIIFFSALSFSEVNNKNVFTSRDIICLKQSIIDNNLSLKEEGAFLDFKTPTPTREFLINKIEEQGVEYIFPDKQSYNFFIKYLKEIEDKKNLFLFIDKENKYKSKNNKEYSFFISTGNNNLTIHINILSPTGDEDFPYSEQSYLYTFEKVYKKIVLSKMNVAG